MKGAICTQPQPTPTPSLSRMGNDCRASTAWDFPKDLGILMINMGFRDFAVKSWDFTIAEKIKFC